MVRIIKYIINHPVIILFFAGIIFYFFGDQGVNLFKTFIKNPKRIFDSPFTGPVKIGTKFGAVDNLHLLPHNGVDVLVDGEYIFAREQAIVKFSQTNDGGKQAFLLFSDGWKMGFAHLDRYAPNLVDGSKVAPNEIIAVTGNTGKSTGPHSHVTLTNPLGIKVNPEDHIMFNTLIS